MPADSLHCKEATFKLPVVCHKIHIQPWRKEEVVDRKQALVVLAGDNETGEVLQR
jgi:hypothetical protein